MDKSITFSRSGKPSSSRRMRLLPPIPNRETPTPVNSSSSTTDTTQSPETSRGESLSGGFKGITWRVRPTGEMTYPFIFHTTNVANEETNPSTPRSLKRLNEIGPSSDAQAAIPTSSYSHNILADTDSQEEETGSGRVERKGIHKRLVDILVVDSEEDEEEIEGGSSQAVWLDRGVTSSLLEESVSKAIKEMQEIERRRKGKSIEIQGKTEIRDGEEAIPARWKNRMEETVNRLVAENAAQQALLKEQGEQMVKVVDLVRRMISLMGEKPNSAHPRPTTIPTPSNVGPSNSPAGPSRMRRDTTTSSQPQSSAKRTKHSGSPGGPE